MLPAYGRVLLDLRRAGQRPARPVIVTDCFDVARCVQRVHDRFALVAPPDGRAVDWALVAGLAVGVAVRYDGPAPWVRALRAARPAAVWVCLSHAGDPVEDFAARVVALAEPDTRAVWMGQTQSLLERARALRLAMSARREEAHA